MARIVQSIITRALEDEGYTHLKSFEGGAGTILAFEKGGIKYAVEVSVMEGD
jgi:hypothetical protein